jgi:hypothetical protein
MIDQFYFWHGLSDVPRFSNQLLSFLISSMAAARSEIASASSWILRSVSCAFSPSSTRRRMAVARLMPAHRENFSTAATVFAGSRALMEGLWPVAGRPRFLLGDRIFKCRAFCFRGFGQMLWISPVPQNARSFFVERPWLR